MAVGAGLHVAHMSWWPRHSHYNLPVGLPKSVCSLWNGQTKQFTSHHIQWLSGFWHPTKGKRCKCIHVDSLPHSFITEDVGCIKSFFCNEPHSTSPLQIPALVTGLIWVTHRTDGTPIIHTGLIQNVFVLVPGFTVWSKPLPALNLINRLNLLIFHFLLR